MASYLRELDRDGLPSIRRAALEEARNRKITTLDDDLRAYRASSPTSGILRYDSPGVSRRTLLELQEQQKLMREELRKKDALIQHLASLEAAPKVHRTSDSVRLDTLYLGDRQALDTARSELATLQVKYDKHSIELKEYESRLEQKEIRIRELQHALDTSRSNEVRLTEHVQSLRDKLRDLEDRTGSYEAVAGRSEYAISALQRETRDSQDKVLELESRLRAQLEEREAAEARARSTELKYNDLVSQLSNLLRVDTLDTLPISVDVIMRKMTDLVQENAMLRGKILTLNETLNNTELETKASRETIMRLVSEVGREQKVATRYTADIENLRMERDNAVATRHDLEREIDLLKERLEASHKSLEATRKELELREGRFTSLDREAREASHNVRSASTQYHLFKEQLASLLGNAYTSVNVNEEAIKDAIRQITQDNREMTMQMESWDAQNKSLRDQLENQIDLHRNMAARAKQAETDALDMEQRLRSAEGDLAAGDVLRDNFKLDKEKYLRTLQRLGEAMKMDRISVDLGLDMTMDALIARAEQLVRMEADTLADRSTHIYNLQRKVKSLKEQLESKDLHIDLLRKKITALEERVHGRTELLKEKDGETLRVRKLEKVIEKYKMQLQDARQESQNMKAQLLGATELKMRTVEQRKELEELARQVEELETVRKKQGRKIQSLKSEVETHEHEHQEKRVVSDNAVQALSSELRTTKSALHNLQHREKQLLDFRNVVSRMLGLDMNTLAVPDYEIISRLEKLIRAHHTQAFTTMSLEEALADVEDGFLSDYENARRTVEATDPIIKRSRERSRRKAAKARARARSLSPMRRDPRSY